VILLTTLTHNPRKNFLPKMKIENSTESIVTIQNTEHETVVTIKFPKWNPPVKVVVTNEEPPVYENPRSPELPSRVPTPDSPIYLDTRRRLFLTPEQAVPPNSGNYGGLGFSYTRTDFLNDSVVASDTSDTQSEPFEGLET